MSDRSRSASEDRGRGRSRSNSGRGNSRSRSRSPAAGRRGGGDRRDDSGPKSLIVRNLSFDVRADGIKDLFSQYGDVRDVYIPLDYHTRRPRGFAFVEFLDSRDAREAYDRCMGKELNGRPLTIEFAKEKRKTPEEMRKESGRGGNDRYRDMDRGGRRRSRSRSYSRGRGGGGGGRNDRDRDRRRSRSRSRDRGDRRRRSRSRSWNRR